VRRRKKNQRARAKNFPVTIFVLTLAVMAALTTIQNYLLGSLIDYATIPASSAIIVAVYWVAVSAGFTLYTRWQIDKNYDQPLKNLAAATKKVAGGDFSIYVRPLHTADKADYLDIMTEDFNRMVAELGSIETLKTEFFTDVSHEIKTPLTVAQSNAELIKSGKLSEAERNECAAAIIGATKKLSGLVSNILKLNKLERLEILPVPVKYDLCAQLCESALQFEKI